MAREVNRLNARAVAGIHEHGRHADGGGLYLSVSPNGGRRWVFLYRWHGKPTEIGFGSARDVTLARARELARQARGNLAEGINPKDVRKSTKAATFGECADQVIDTMRPSWRNEKHAAQWKMTLSHYAAPLRRLPVDKIGTDDVLSVLKPLWNVKPEANRGRAYISYTRQGLRRHPAPLQNAGRNIVHRPGGHHRRATAFGCWHIQSRLARQLPRSSTISPQQRGASSQILHLSISAYRCLLRSMNALVQKSPITNWK